MWYDDTIIPKRSRLMGINRKYDEEYYINMTIRSKGAYITQLGHVLPAKGYEWHKRSIARYFLPVLSQVCRYPFPSNSESVLEIAALSSPHSWHSCAAVKPSSCRCK